MLGLGAPPHNCQEAIAVVIGLVEYTVNSLFVW
jgi:hypothetical protein